MFDALRHDLQGDVLDENAPLFDEARAVWNSVIDRRPGLIIRCRDAGDVRRAVRFAHDSRLLVAVRGGGHHIAGNAVCEGGVCSNCHGLRIAIDIEGDGNRPGACKGHRSPGCRIEGKGASPRIERQDQAIAAIYGRFELPGLLERAELQRTPLVWRRAPFQTDRY